MASGFVIRKSQYYDSVFLMRIARTIDDEPGVRESLRLILGEEFEVLEAADGAAALAILSARRVDVALLDVRMPGEPGSRVLPQILAIDDSIPVILITADPHLRMAVDAMKAFGDGLTVLAK